MTTLVSIPRWRLCLYAFVAGALTVAVAAMFALGQGLVKVPVEKEVETRFRNRIEIQWKERIEYRENVKTRTVTRDVPVVVYIDGGVRVERELVTVVDYQRDASGSSDASGTKTGTSDSQQKLTERTVLPSWTVGVLVGGQFAGTSALKLPNAPGLVVGIEAGYRVPLPLPPRYSLWVEAWGTTSGAAGGGLRGEF